MSSISDSDHEARLRSLASMVAECRSLSSKLGSFDATASRKAAPFLHRQLMQALKLLGQAVQEAGGPEEEGDASRGFFARLKRGKRRSDKAGVAEDDGLQGNSWTIPIPELIGFLSNARKTGVLWVHAPSETFLVQIKDGALLHATSDGTPEGDRLGEILVEQGALRSSDLTSFLEENLRSGMLGVALFREGVVSQSELLHGLSAQVQRLFHRMLNAKHAVFRFQEGVELLVEHHIRLNVTQLLLEAAKTLDEASAARLEAAAHDVVEDGLETLGDVLEGEDDEEAALSSRGGREQRRAS